MRRIGHLDQEQDATTFRDYLLTQGIKSQIDRGSDGWDVWVLDEDRRLAAQQELAEFTAAPHSEKYRSAITAAQRLREEELREEIDSKKRQINLARRWDRPLFQQVPITLILIAVSIFITVATQFGESKQPLQDRLSIAEATSFDHPGAPAAASWMKHLYEVRHGEPWRLITPIFLHFSPLHLLFNMMWMFHLGGAIEMRRGWWRLLTMVLIIAALSNVAQFYASGPNFGGMSGVVYGLFGYIWIRSTYDPESGFYIPPQTIMLMLIWFFVCAFGLVGQVANFAHGGGLIVGVLMGLVACGRRIFKR